MTREVVKDRTTREVARVLLPSGEDVHQKTIRLEGHLFRRFAALLGRDAARNEQKRLLELRARGIMAPEPLACTRRTRGGLPVSLTLTTRTLVEFRPLRAGEELARGFPSEWGRYLRRLHDLGIEHRDLHRGNVLVRDLGADRFDFALLDADRVRFVPGRLPISARQRQGLLALRGFRGLREPSAFREFLTAYGSNLGFVTAAALRAAADEDLRRHLARRSRRALRDNPDFGPLSIGPVDWQIRRGFMPEAGAEIGPRDLAQIFKRSATSSVWRGGDGAIVKAFHKRSWLGTMHLGPKSRAHASFQKGHLLELLGIATPRVLACASAGPKGASLLVTEEILGALQASEFVRRTDDAHEVQALARAIGDLVGRLHAAGLSHRDLKGRNILRTANGFVLMIDLEALRSGSRRRGAKDLVRLFRSALEFEGKTRPWFRTFARAYLRAAQTGRKARLQAMKTARRRLATRGGGR